MAAIETLFIAGITNIIFLLLVLFSCRCIGFWKLTSSWLGNEKYIKFYKYHCYYWYGFIISVLIHTILAFYLFGWPF
jgi:hypothetical protein